MNDRDFRQGKTMLTILKDCIAKGNEEEAVKHLAFLISNTRGQAYHDAENAHRERAGEQSAKSKEATDAVHEQLRVSLETLLAQHKVALGALHEQHHASLAHCTEGVTALRTKHGTPKWDDAPVADKAGGPTT